MTAASAPRWLVPRQARSARLRCVSVHTAAGRVALRRRQIFHAPSSVHGREKFAGVCGQRGRYERPDRARAAFRESVRFVGVARPRRMAIERACGMGGQARKDARAAVEESILVSAIHCATPFRRSSMRLAWLAAIAGLAAPSASAQTVGLFADAAGTNCNIVTQFQAPVTAYVVLAPG